MNKRIKYLLLGLSFFAYTAASHSYAITNSDKATTVTDYNQLKVALKNPAVKNINIASDITILEADIPVHGDKVIKGQTDGKGNPVTIDENKLLGAHILDPNTTYRLSGVKIINQAGDQPFLWSDNTTEDVNITYSDISSSGTTGFNNRVNGHITLEGHIYVDSTDYPEIRAKSLTIKEGCEFKTNKNLNHRVFDLGNAFKQEKNSSVKVDAGAPDTMFYFNPSPSEPLDFDEAGTLELSSSSGRLIYVDKPIENSKAIFEGTSFFNGVAKNGFSPLVFQSDVSIQNGAHFYAKNSAKGAESTILGGNKVNFEAGSNFSVEGKQSTALGSYQATQGAGTAYTFDTPVSVWNIKNESTDPDESYNRVNQDNKFKFSFVALGVIGQQKVNSINSTDCDSLTYKNETIRKISGGDQNTNPPINSSILIKYTDEDGKDIHPDMNLKGKVGESYDVSGDQYKLSIDGYQLDTSKIPNNIRGMFTVNKQVVQYFYKKNSTPHTLKNIYRLYNPNTGEHLYTESSYEYNVLASKGWNKEGVEWKAPIEGNAVYRLYNPNTGEHFYTESSYEYNMVAKAGWNKEGLAFYSDTSKKLPIYRAFNPNAKKSSSHFYTSSSYEYNMVVKAGWNKEGTAFYGSK